MNCVRRWIKDPFPGLSHWVGAGLSVAALVVLLVQAGPRPWHATAFAIYGASLILLYAASALAHSVHCSPRAAERLDRFDYAAIFVLIAGTYTPMCLVPLRGAWGWSILGAEWALAVAGILGVLLGRGWPAWLRIALYVVMGWLAVVAIVPLVMTLPAWAMVWLFAGGIAYSAGAYVFAADKPHLWPGRFTAHDLWHCLVLAGSACHFVVMSAFVAEIA